jgi:hypothetical protein
LRSLWSEPARRRDQCLGSEAGRGRHLGDGGAAFREADRGWRPPRQRTTPRGRSSGPLGTVSCWHLRPLGRCSPREKGACQFSGPFSVWGRCERHHMEHVEPRIVHGLCEEGIHHCGSCSQTTCVFCRGGGSTQKACQQAPTPQQLLEGDVHMVPQPWPLMKPSCVSDLTPLQKRMKDIKHKILVLSGPQRASLTPPATSHCCPAISSVSTAVTVTPATGATPLSLASSSLATHSRGEA